MNDDTPAPKFERKATNPAIDCADDFGCAVSWTYTAIEFGFACTTERKHT